MKPKEWTLPSGARLRIDEGAVEIAWTKEAKFVCLTASLEQSEDLLAVLNVEVSRARLARGGAK